MAVLRSIAVFAGVCALAALSACSTAPRHPALAQAAEAGRLPPLVPLRRFVANVDFAAGFVISPDGRRLLWNQTVGTDSGLAVRAVEGGETRTFATGYLARPAGPIYTWLSDSRHVAYLKDLRGDENTHLHVFDTEAPFAPWAVTPWPGVRSYFVAAGAPGTARFFFASNRRDRATLDLYEADAADRSIREVARSDGHVLHWLVGSDRRLAGRVRQLGAVDGSDAVFEVLQEDGSWRQVTRFTGWDSVWIHRVNRVAGRAWAASNLGRDRMALVEIDLATGAERVLVQHPVVDVSQAVYRRDGGPPVAYVVDDGQPAVHYLDGAYGQHVADAIARARREGAVPAEPLVTRTSSHSDDGSRMVLRAAGVFDEAELLLDRRSGQVSRLNPAEPERAAVLSPEEPYTFRASDGRTIHGYVTRPRGVTGPAPMVVSIHGGPWVREHWSPAGYRSDQFLANRGYAVLTINYRGSSGYGREFMNAARRETFGRVQKDIAEAAQWAVDQGIADPRAMAVLGGSFGGFSVMAQLIQKHHDWKCGINLVGVANWPRVMENWPPFWRNRHMFEAFYGNPALAAERRRMLEESPISHIDRITAPMLVIHGANDVRVLRQDSDEVVEGLRALGRPVEYLSFADEGHQVRRWRNRLALWRRVEDTLAGCLGGRSAGWDLYELMPR